MAPPRRKTHFSNVEIEQMLSQITLAETHISSSSSSSSSSAAQQLTLATQENFEPLGPIIRQLHDQGLEDVFLKSLGKFVEDKEGEIEKICGENYQDFVSSVSTLLTVRQGTVHLRHRIGELDSQMGEVGRALMEKKKSLLKHRRVAENLDSAIETLQSCLRVLDLVNRVGEMIREGKYWGALRSLEDLLHLPPSPLSQTPFFLHILSSLPSLRSQIRDAVTASEKSWLFDVRSSSGQIGRLATEEMARRIKKWRNRKEKDGGLLGGTARLGRVGGAVESVMNEKNEFDVLNNEEIKIDFKPLYQCIHIYDALNARAELQRNYQEDRKTQANLILSQRSSPSPSTILSVLPSLMEELIGFFIIESHVLRSTRDFRSSRDVDDLWEDMCRKIVEIVGGGLEGCEDLEVFLGVKAQVLMFIQTLEGYSYSVDQLNTLLLTLFERYSKLLERKFATAFDEIVTGDDHQPMQVEDAEEFDRIISVCWIKDEVIDELAAHGFPLALPFSQTYPLCCIDIRQFVDQFYQFVEGVSDHHKDIDELLRKALDNILIHHVSENIAKMLKTMNNLSQIAQVVVNIEHFRTACTELEIVLMNLRAAQRGGAVRLLSLPSFTQTLSLAQDQISTVIASKLDDFFELAEISWMPITRRREGEPADFLDEMIGFLNNFVDAVLSALGEDVRVVTYRRACQHIAGTMMGWLTQPDIPLISENALANISNDVNFIDSQMERLGKTELADVFTELKSTTTLILTNSVHAYINQPSLRRSTYAAINPKQLALLLNKLAKFGMSQGGREYERGQMRRAEAEQVRRMAVA
ncbi:putative exocyst complex subunit Sec15 [Mrakia frigida]|uniref:Rab GTPase-binding exocyst subunit SEC15 n=1 Tax=Mrakia frigida TaxID=29902 RepID=UPI003FCBFC24